MLATFITESVLLVYTLVRYRLTPISRVVAASLFFLAFFQLCEYNVCGRFGVEAAIWSRMGYVAITMLPPLGVHFVQLIAKRGWRWIKWAAYTNALVWAGVFGISERAFSGHVCAGNYVIFQLTPFASWAYGVYYYSWLLAGIIMAVYFAYRAKKHIREALILQTVGYLIFLVPTSVVAYLTPATRSGIPSIMCGFAVLYAFIMVFGILPQSLDNEKA
jgi:hypothetical protein